MSARAEKNDPSSRMLPRASKSRAIESVVADTVAGLLSAVSSQPPRDALHGHMGFALRARVARHVEDRFSSVERSVDESMRQVDTSAICSRDFPSQMRAQPRK